MAGSSFERGVLLTRGRHIAWVGPEDRLGTLPDTELVEIDLAGRALVPGLCDAHLHLVQAALAQGVLDLRGTDTLTDLQRLIRDRSSTTLPAAWILGHGWERHRLLGGRSASPALLDLAAPDRPVFLTSKDLHSAWLNSAGMQRVLALPDLPAGSVVQRHDGIPTGLVLEAVFELRDRLLPEPSPDEKLAALRAYLPRLWASGITAVHGMETAEELAVVQRALRGAQHERVRVLQNLAFDTPRALLDGAELFDTTLPGWLCMGGAKLFLDGTFGSLTAAVSQPYTGTGERGLLRMDAAELEAWLRAAAAVGVPAVMHAIGDRAVELALDGLATQRWPPGTMHRLEHAQLLSDRIVTQRDLRGLVFSSQPSHAWDDQAIAERHLDHPDGRRWAYPFRTLIDRGGLVVFGSDAPVEGPDPWKGIQAAVTRLESAAREPWVPQERITLGEALAAHSCNPARLHAHGFATGSLEPGKLADLVVLEPDPFASPAEAGGGSIGAALTVLDGEIVHRRPGTA